MGKASRDKGYRAENELAKKLRETGIDAKRQPLSGGAPGFPGDILVSGLEKPVEVKWRENNPKRLWEWLEKNSAVALRRNHYPWLMIIRLEDWMKYMELKLRL